MESQHSSGTYGIRKHSISRSILNSILVILIIIVTVAGIHFYILASERYPYGSEFQAVFLDNNQVYFGTVVKDRQNTIELTNVFYLQTNNSNTLTTQQEDTKAFTLVKLGNELHRPQDTMYIFKEHILFIENIDVRSDIVSAIEEYRSK